MLRPLGAEPPAAQIPTDRGARQPHAIALGEQLGDRIAGPQKPRQAELIGGAVANQRDEFLLLALGQGRLFTPTAAATLLGKPREATLPIASDPAVHRVGVDPKHPRGLGLGHPVQHRLDGPVTQRGLRRSRQ